MGIKIKHQDPTINELSTNDLVVNVEQGSLFFRSYEKLFRLKGDDLSTAVTESGGGLSSIIQDSSGKIGIGTTSPSALLDIRGDEEALRIISSTGGNTHINFNPGGSSSGNYFSYPKTGNTYFRTFDGSVYSNKVFISGSGNVGIGNVEPSFKLSVTSPNGADANDATIEIETGTGVSGSGSRLQMGGTATYSFIQSHQSQPLAINPLGADTSNFVGIGTTTPSAPLMVRGDIGLGDLTTNSRMAGRDQIRLMSDTYGYGAGIGFTDQVTGGGRWDDASQHGTLRFYHSDSHMLGAGTSFKLSSNQPLSFDVGGNLYLTKDNAALVMGATGSSNANFTSRIQFKEDADPFHHGAEIIFDGDNSAGGAFEIGVRDGSTTFNRSIRIDRRCSTSGSVATPQLIFGSDGFLNVYTLLRTRNRDIGSNNHNKHRSGMYIDTRNTSGMNGQFDPLNGGTNGNPLGTAESTGAVHRNLIYFYASTGSSDAGRICHETSGVVVSGGTDYRNRSTLHLCPGDDNDSKDYVSIHGSNDPETIKLYTNGNIDYSGTLTDTSDRRIKKNINPLSGSLDKVLKLKGVSFNWKDEKKGTEQIHGLIAQEAREIIPEIVREMPKNPNEKDPTLGISYIDLIPFLIESIKDQQKQIDKLKAKLNEQ